MLLHVSSVSLDAPSGPRAVLIAGAPGAGKSDLALRLIDEGAQLIADDQTDIAREGDALYASSPESIHGLIEVRHVGLLRVPAARHVEVALYIELAADGAVLERLPEEDPVFILDYPVRRLRLPAFAASTSAKIRAALKYPRADE